jgi:DNA polymerase-3 subunit epsilon
MCGFDLESTGVDVEQDRIVTAAVVLTGVVPAQWEWLVNPGIPIPPGATAVHGVTDQMVQLSGQPPLEAIDRITDYLSIALSLGIPVVCANAPFDLTLLDRECRRWMLPTLEDRLEGALYPVVDVQVLDRQLDQYRKGSRTLVALCEHYKVRIDRAHNATADAKAALRVAWKICQTSTTIAQCDLFDLHQKQVEWRHRQQRSLAGYFRKQGKHAEAESVNPAWPVIPLELPF